MAAQLEPLEACTRLLHALGERAPDLTPAQAVQALHGYSFFDCGGAVVMTRGPEIHAAAPIARRGRWITRRDLRAVLGGILDTYGYAATAVMPGNEDGHAFVERLGFEPIGTRSDGASLYKLEGRHATH